MFEEEGQYIEEVEMAYQVEIIFRINPKLHQENYNISLS